MPISLIPLRHGYPPALLARSSGAEEIEAIHLRYDSALETARDAIRAKRYGEALALTREARGLPGKDRDPAVLDIWAALGRHCVRIGLRGAWRAAAFPEGEGETVALMVTKTGPVRLSWCADISLRLIDVITGSCRQTFQVSRRTPFAALLPTPLGPAALCLSADEQWLLTDGWDDALRLWEVPTGRCACVFQGQPKDVRSLALSADNRFAVAGYVDESGPIVGLWEAKTGRNLRILRGHEDVVTAVCLGPDARWAVSAGMDATLKLWDLASGRCLHTFEGHQDAVSSLCLTPDGRRALSVSKDRTARLWEVETGCCLRTFRDPRSERIDAVCLTPDGRWALSAGWGSGVVRLWESTTGDSVREFGALTGCVTHLSLAPDGHCAFSRGEDKLIHQWMLDWDLESRETADMHDGARPYLADFLTLHTPSVAPVPSTGEVSGDSVTRFLMRRGRPAWSEEAFQLLLDALGSAGYGWLRPEGVRRRLEEMARTWDVPPALPGTHGPEKECAVCPQANCGAPLYFDRSRVRMMRRCPYCGTEFVQVPHR
jgi:hypothetical protein